MIAAKLTELDLITPDGDRVWVVSGWDSDGNIHAWPIQDYVEDRYPSKTIPDNPRRYAPLTRINASAESRDQFISDYIASKDHMNELHFGIEEPMDPGEWIGIKIYPYGFRGGEHIVRDHNPWLRTLTLDPVRAGNPGHFEVLDTWEVLASWHTAFGKTTWRTRQKRKLRQGGEYVYRLYDSAGRLLYVGVTNDIFRRWREHSLTKSWWHEVSTFTQEIFPDRASAEAFERQAIRSERPIHNILHTQGVS